MNIIYTKTAIKVINSLDRSTKQRLKIAIMGLTEIPPIGDIKQLKGLSVLTYRLRVGKFRVIYEYVYTEGDQTLVIKDIGSRGDIYK